MLVALWSQGYRHFRIVKTGPNEDETAGPLMYIATLELYGILIETAPAAAAAAANTVASVPVNAPKPIIAQGPAAHHIPVRPSMPLSAKSTGPPSATATATATATAATVKGAAKATKPPGSPDLKKAKKSPATSDKKEKKPAAETSDKTKTKTNRAPGTPVRV